MITGARADEYAYEGAWNSRISLFDGYVPTSDTPRNPWKTYYIKNGLLGSTIYTPYGGSSYSGTFYDRNYIHHFTDEVMSFTIHQSMGNDQFSIGNFCSSYVECTIYTSPASYSYANFNGKWIEVWVQAANIDFTDTESEYYREGYDGWHLIGTFYCEKATYTDEKTTFTAYDRIKYIKDANYVPQFSEYSEQPLELQFLLACEEGNIWYGQYDAETTTAFSESPYSFPYDIFSGMPCRQAIQQIASYLGKNIVCDEYGVIVLRQVKPYSFSAPYQLNDDWVTTINLEEDPYQRSWKIVVTDGTYVNEVPVNQPDYTPLVAYSKLLDEEGDYKPGSSSQCYYIWNKYYHALDSSIAHTTKLINGSPFIQLSDTLYSSENSANLVILGNTIQYDGGLYNDLSLDIPTEAQDYGTETISEKLTSFSDSAKQLEDDVAELQSDVSDIQGDISNLQSNMTTAQGNITSLQGDVADLKSKSWTELTLESGVTAGTIGGISNKVMIRKVGDRVDILGSVKVTWDGSSSVLITTVPQGCIPSGFQMTFLASCARLSTQMVVALVTIASTGTNAGKLRIISIKTLDGTNVTTEHEVVLSSSYYIAS